MAMWLWERRRARQDCHGHPAALPIFSMVAYKTFWLRGLEEPECVLGVADQKVLGLLVVLQHHQVGLATDTGVLVAAEGGVRRVGVIVVHPDPAGLDVAAGAVGRVAVAGPDACTQPEDRVVRD